MSRSTTATVLLSLGGAVIGSACMTNAVVFKTATRFAVEIQTTEEQPGVKVGYQRFEGVTMPLRTPTRDEAGNPIEGGGELLPEAYPVLAGFMQSSSGFWPSPERPLGTTIKQVFATGEAAGLDGAPAAVLSALDLSVAPKEGMPSKQGSDSARQLLELLRRVEPRNQLEAWRILSSELDKEITDANAAKAAIQDAASDESMDPVLARAIERIQPLADQGSHSGDKE
jgi:hypothetical protein